LSYSPVSFSIFFLYHFHLFEAVPLLRLLMGSVLPAESTVLADLQFFLLFLLIPCGRVVSPFTLFAAQYHDLSHNG